MSNEKEINIENMKNIKNLSPEMSDKVLADYLRSGFDMPRAHENDAVVTTCVNLLEALDKKDKEKEILKREKYCLLTNQTYLYLLQNKQEEVNFVAIGKKLGLTRQTVSKEYGEFSFIEGWDKLFDIKNFHVEEKSKYAQALKILKDLRPEISSIAEAARILGVSRSILYDLNLDIFQNKIKKGEEKVAPIACVYTVKYKDEIIYIGTTQDFEKRKKQHLSAIKKKETEKLLYKFCIENEIEEKDLVIEPFFTEEELCDRYTMENKLIKLVNPKCNVVGQSG